MGTRKLLPIKVLYINSLNSPVRGTDYLTGLKTKNNCLLLIKTEKKRILTVKDTLLKNNNNNKKSIYQKKEKPN